MPRKKRTSKKPGQAQTAHEQQKWKVCTYPPFDRFFQKNPHHIPKRKQFLDDVQQDPYTSKTIKLKGYPDDTYRYRSGDVRIFYNIDKPDRAVHAMLAVLRKNAY